ncbi:glycosyltransferase family 4 protein [Paracoccus suum]|uniref:glycosyltransferase family 4 protein n=1 Tax=Paracoccus suum TaxID=2259340 RepID=UPI001F54207E|nr:glycosyltransferase family 1 protein [Paracoccus suum]
MSSQEPAPQPPAILLDVSRLISRVGLGPLTGIDRVEAAWLEHLQGRPHSLIARIARRQLLLDPPAGAELLRWLAEPQSVPPPTSLIARLRRARSARARAEEALAARAVATGTGRGLGLRRTLARAMPQGGTWLALGHANLAPGPWAALGGLRRVVMIHDTIPLDHPQFTRPDQVEAFERRLIAALGGADLVLTVSQATRADVLRWADALGLRRPQVVAAPIGTTLAAPTEVPADIPLDRPLFLALGTIEPRKNHAVLLEAWARLAQRMPAGQVPRLVIAGRRGWLNADVFARLDALPPGGPVIERADLTDGEIAALMERAHALLMPSRAEGFGLPLTEAAGRGVPVLAAPGPAAREVLGGAAQWLGPDDAAAWAAAIGDIARAPLARRKPLAIRGWSDHFSTVEALLATTGT